MRRVFTALGWIVAAIWSIFVFAASNGPKEVQTRTDDWLSLPIMDQLPTMVLNFIGSPLVLAISFLGLGIAIGVKFANRTRVVPINKWWLSLGNDMTLLAHQIEEIYWARNEHEVSAKINVVGAKINAVGAKAKKNGLAFPSNASGFTTFQSLLPYLHQVSAYLQDSEIEYARSAATRLSSESLT
jgi:hypothetical protein